MILIFSHLEESRHDCSSKKKKRYTSGYIILLCDTLGVEWITTHYYGYVKFEFNYNIPIITPEKRFWAETICQLKSLNIYFLECFLI